MAGTLAKPVTDPGASDFLPAFSKLAVSGIVLSGGRSRRMGTDKGKLRWPPGNAQGPTLLEVTVARVASVCEEVLVVGSRGPVPAGTRQVSDRYPDGGSLGGIASGLLAALHPRALVVATDMPFLNVTLLRWLAERPGEWDALVPLSREGLPEPLHAVYAKTCLATLCRRVDAGQLKIQDYLGEVETQLVLAAEWHTHDPDARSFFNVNTPEDFAEASDLFTQR